MQVPRFSPRISLIEMALRLAPRNGCPSRPTLPCPCPALFVTTDRKWAPQGTGSDWKNLPSTAHTDRHHVVLIYKMLKPSVFKSSTQNVFIPPRDAIRKKRSRNTSIDTHKVCFESHWKHKLYIFACMLTYVAWGFAWNFLHNGSCKYYCIENYYIFYKSYGQPHVSCPS